MLPAAVAAIANVSAAAVERTIYALESMKVKRSKVLFQARLEEAFGNKAKFDQPVRGATREWDFAGVIQDENGIAAVFEFVAPAFSAVAAANMKIGDVRGLRIAHLQCHIGIDTLCLARRGASCVGLDFSPRAIAAARLLQQKTGLDARFVEGNVYDARQLIDGDFDMVYVTWGAIGWLPDEKEEYGASQHSAWETMMRSHAIANGVFVAAIAVFLLGSLGCAASDGLGQLVAGRFVQGVGGAMMVPVGRLILVRSVPKAELVSAMAVMGVPSLGAASAGFHSASARRPARRATSASAAAWFALAYARASLVVHAIST